MVAAKCVADADCHCRRATRCLCRKDIAIRYLTTYFLLDIVSVLPLGQAILSLVLGACVGSRVRRVDRADLVVVGDDQAKLARLARIVRLLRLVRLLKLLK
jgi:hypothetical protein